jgi:hypothetical protein
MLKAIALLKKSCPECMVELTVAQNNLGLLRLKQKRYKEADASFSQAIAMRERFSQSSSPELAQTIDSLAYARKMEHRKDDAEKLALRAANMFAEFR